MNILVDQDIPCASWLFGKLGNVRQIPGHMINKQSIKNFNAIIVRSHTKINKDLLHESNINFVGTTTSGIDHVDYNWISKSNISFHSASGCNSIAVVEYVISSMLYISQKYKFYLKDKTVGIVGLGNIGSLLKRRLNLIGINTLVCDLPLQNLYPKRDWMSLEKIVSNSDILTLHVPLINNGKYKTHHLIDKNVLEALPNKCIIINTCRGSVINNKDLLNILIKRKDITVVLDVWEFEPSIILDLVKLVEIGTAHIAGASFEGKIRSVLKIFHDYSKFLGSKLSFNLENIISLSTGEEFIKYIYLNDISCSQNLLYFISKLVYNIKYSDMQLRSLVKDKQSFLYVRNKHYRREWSSLSVKLDNIDRKILFKKLGFHIL